MMGALEGVVVLDLTRQFWSSLSGAFLADFDAQVIRLELAGLDAGSAPTSDEATDGTWNYSADLVHRNKRSVKLDLASESGRGVLEALLAKADILLTDWPVAELEAARLDYASVMAIRPEIIFGRASGFGPEGPDKDLPAIDELAAARTGMMPILPQPGKPPVYTGAGAMHTTVMLAFGVVTALMHRADSGEGQEVDVSLFAANMYGASLDLQAFLAIGSGDRLLNPISRLDVSNPMSGSLYPSADGRWITLTMPDTDRWWPGLAEAVGIDPNDERFDSHEKRCDVNRLALIDALEEGFKQQPGTHWRQIFEEKRMSADVIEQFDFPAGDPQALQNRYILELDHPSHGKVKSLGFPIFMSESPARLQSLAPCAGQHSAEVLHDLLGFSEEAINALSTQGVIG